MNNLTQEVFEIIKEYPGIDTPEVCVEVALGTDKLYLLPENLKGPNLALWLMKNAREDWVKTCESVDELLQSGQISFSDDGELRATGYSA